jgi:acetoin utilization deacetylase AcuC-like enzyme
MPLLGFHDPRCFVAPPDDVDAPNLIKANLLRERLEELGVPVEWQPVTPASWDELGRVHAADYVEAVRTGEPRERVLPAYGFWTPQLAESVLWESGSMVSAALAALERGEAVASLSSGFHHAHHAKAGTYCLANGLVLAALRACDEGLERPVFVLDCDYHYGNGTDDIVGRFFDTPGVAIAHRTLGKRFKKPYQAPEYMQALKEVCRRIRQRRYGLVLYQAGMDVLRGDPMGGLLTSRQAFERDRLVFAACRDAGVPLAWNLAGGYSRDEAGTLAPTLQGHLNTVVAWQRVYAGSCTVEPVFA